MEWLRRQRYLIDYSLSALARRPGKHLGLLLVYTLIVFLLASVMLFTQSLRREAALVLAESPEIILQRQVAGRHDLMPSAYLEKIGTIRGVAAKYGRLWGYFYDPAVRANYTLLVPPESSTQHQTPAPGEIAIGAGIARTRGLAVGDYLSLRSARGEPFSFRVASILSQSTELVSSDLMLLSADDFRRFFDYPEDRVTDIVLQVRNPREVRKVAGEGDASPCRTPARSCARRSCAPTTPSSAGARGSSSCCWGRCSPSPSSPPTAPRA
jgi:hypothetical protein